MGLFGFLSKYTKEESFLIEIYTKKFEPGLSEQNAKTFAENLIDECIMLSKTEGMYNVINFGDYILENEHEFPEMKIKRKDGMKDIDIQWLWNLSDVARKSMIKFDHLQKMGILKSLLDQKMDQNHAVKKLKHMLPTYYLHEFSEKLTDNNRPLPYELKNIVDIFTSEITDIELVKLKDDIELASSFNAFIRKRIKAGAFD